MAQCVGEYMLKVGDVFQSPNQVMAKAWAYMPAQSLTKPTTPTLLFHLHFNIFIVTLDPFCMWKRDCVPSLFRNDATSDLLPRSTSAALRHAVSATAFQQDVRDNHLPGAKNGTGRPRLTPLSRLRPAVTLHFPK